MHFKTFLAFLLTLAAVQVNAASLDSSENPLRIPKGSESSLTTLFEKQTLVFSEQVVSKREYSALNNWTNDITRRFHKDVFDRYKSYRYKSFVYSRNEDLNNDGHLDYAITDTKDNDNIGLSSSDSGWMIFLNDGTDWFFYVDTIVLNASFTVEPLRGDKSAIAMESSYRRSVCTMVFEVDANSIILYEVVSLGD